MKKIVTILIVSILVMQSGGVIFVLQIQQVLNSISISKLLEKDDDNFSEIRILKADFEKSKIDDHEFYYKNELYDIKSIFKKGTFYKIIAIRDNEEINILEKFKKVFEGNKNQKSKTPDTLVKLLSLVFEMPSPMAPPFHKMTIKNIYISSSENTIYKSLTVPTPPPLNS